MTKDEFAAIKKTDHGTAATDAQEGMRILYKHFLGEDWHVVDPLCNAQVNTVAIYEILKKYPSGSIRRIKKHKRRYS